MGDSLTAINVDLLTDSVNSVVHGSLLPSYPLLPPPQEQPTPSSRPLSSAFPDGISRFPSNSGIPQLPILSSLPTFSFPIHVSGNSQATANSSTIVPDSASYADSNNSSSSLHKLSSAPIGCTGTTTPVVCKSFISLRSIAADCKISNGTHSPFSLPQPHPVILTGYSQSLPDCVPRCSQSLPVNVPDCLQTANLPSSSQSFPANLPSCSQTHAVSMSQCPQPLPGNMPGCLQSLPGNMPGCPPVFIMFSLRLPLPDSNHQVTGGKGENTALSSSAPAGPRLPSFSPFPLLLPFLPPPVDGQQSQPLHPFPDLQTSTGSSPVSTNLPIPPASFSQSLPLPPLQLPTSLPPLPVPPPRSPATSQSHFALPPLLLHPPITVTGSLPLPPFLPPPISSGVPFPCPSPLSHSPNMEEQTMLPLPPFPPQSFAAFVQSGLPLTSLSTGMPLPPLLPRPAESLSEGNPPAKAETSQIGSHLSKLTQNLPRDASDKIQLPCVSSISTFSSASSSFPPPGFPPLLPLPQVSTLPSFPLLPPLPLPPHAASTAEAGFSLPLLPPFLHVDSEVAGPPPSLFVSIAGQLGRPPFPGQELSLVPFIPSEASPSLPLSSAHMDPLSVGECLERESSTEGRPEQEMDKITAQDISRSSMEKVIPTVSDIENCSDTLALVVEEEMCVEIHDHNRLTLQLAQSKDVGTSLEKATASSHSQKHVSDPSTVTVAGDSVILTAIYSSPSDVCPNSSPPVLSAESQPSSFPMDTDSTTQLGTYKHMLAARVPNTLAQDPKDCYTYMHKSDPDVSYMSAHPGSVQDKITYMQTSDTCNSSYISSMSASSQDKTADEMNFEEMDQVNRQANADQALSMSSFYPTESSQTLNQDFSSLQPLHDRQYSFSNNLPSCAVNGQVIPLEAHVMSQHGVLKQQKIDSNSSLLSTVPDAQQTSYPHVESSFTDIHQHSTLSLANGVEENLNKESQESAVSMVDSCQFPSSLNALTSGFNFSASSAPSISVDPPSQTLLPSVGYSPPGLSNQGLSPNLFSPMDLVSTEQIVAEKEDHTLLTATSSAPVTGTGLGLSTMSASVLDMLLMKADLSSVDKDSQEMSTNRTVPVTPCSAVDTVQSGAAFSADNTLIPVFAGRFCVECNEMCKGVCKHVSIHYQHILDTPLLTRARATLPTCLKLGQSNVTGHLNTTGVFTQIPLQTRTEFGPLQGKVLQLSEAPDVGSFGRWKIFYNGSVRVLDVSDETQSNWMMFVKPARNVMERNVVAFQSGHDIMFVTCKDLDCDVELLFWFAPDYLKMLSGMSKPSQFCPYCPVCSCVFFDRGELRRHSKQAHGDLVIRKWSCSLCSVQFRSVGRLNEHVMAQHMNLKPYVCSTCGKEFADSHNLNTHLTMHAGIKKFGCEICGKRFMQKAHLQSHQSTHTKVKAAQCRFCNKHFVRVSDMRQHELKHTKTQMHSCQQCSKTFHRLELLRRHTNSVHNNERNYMCECCSKTFHTKYKLTRHGQSCKSIKEQAATFVSSSLTLQSSMSSALTLVNPSTMPSHITSVNSAHPCELSAMSVSDTSTIEVCPSFEVAATTFAVSLVTGESPNQATAFCSGNLENRITGNSVRGSPAKPACLAVTNLPVLVNSAG